MEMKITFPGGVRVNAEYKGHEILSDQPVRAGGTGSAPAPFDYFLASIGTCAGFYVKSFLDQRDLSAEGVRIVLSTVKDRETKRISDIKLEIVVPEGFPTKYHRALTNSVNLCSVKKHILEPPRFETVVTEETAPAHAAT